MYRRKRRGQEEMVGFVLVVLIVMVIFVVILGLSVRKKSTEGIDQSIEASQFLDALLEFTSDCSKNGYTYESVEELFDECRKGGVVCSSGETACEILKRTIEGAINASWNINSESPESGFEIRAKIGEEALEGFPIGINNPCTGNVQGADRIIKTSDESIILTLEICS